MTLDIKNRELTACGTCWSPGIYAAILGELPKVLGVYIRAHPAQAVEIENSYRETNEPIQLPVVRDVTCELWLVEFVCARNHTCLFSVTGLARPVFAEQVRSHPL